MIKAIAGDALLLLVTEENVERLKLGESIVINLVEMGNPTFSRIVVGYERTLEEGFKKLEPYIGPHTHVHGKEN